MLPDVSPGAAWLHGVLAAALLFVSVLLHELSHALVAIEHGVPVTGIRLHVFGGVSEMAAEPPTPRAEALIAIVGPLTSFVIAVACYGLGRLVVGSAWLEALTGYLAAVNFIIALFNLVPGFPLDGGRLLRAMLWWSSGRLAWATRWASRTGSAFAFVLVALGVVRGLGGELVGGLWFVLIGVFLYQAARSSHELVQIRERLEPLQAAEVMTRAPLAVDATLPLDTVLDHPFASQRVGGFPVLRDGQLVGFLPWSRVAERAGDGRGRTAEDAMVPLTAADGVGPQASAWAAFLKLGVSPVARVPVVEGSRLVGIISPQDIQHVVAAERRRADVARRAP
jgi:Zn-dependent protease